MNAGSALRDVAGSKRRGSWRCAGRIEELSRRVPNLAEGIGSAYVWRMTFAANVEAVRKARMPVRLVPGRLA